MQARLCLNLKFLVHLIFLEPYQTGAKDPGCLCVCGYCPQLEEPVICTKQFRKIGGIKTGTLFLGNLGWESSPKGFRPSRQPSGVEKDNLKCICLKY